MHKVVLDLPIKFYLFKVRGYIPIDGIPINKKFGL